MKTLRKYGFSLISFVLIFIVICFGLHSISVSTSKNQKESLEKAMNRAVLECYALEGEYPESLEYIEKNYQVVYDHTQFDVEYSVIASNIMPDITIIEK